jgi:hypothetical protein
MESGDEPPWARETVRREPGSKALRSAARGRQRWQALKSSDACEHGCAHVKHVSYMVVSYQHYTFFCLSHIFCEVFGVSVLVVLQSVQ